MEELPDIHWRETQELPARTSTDPPKMTILDVFVLTACAAVSMGLARRSYGNGPPPEVAASIGFIFFGVLWPCLFGALILGHPVILALQTMRGQRREMSLTGGEKCGLIPLVSAAFTILVFLFCGVFSSSEESYLPPLLPIGAFLVALLTNAGASLYALTYTFIRLTGGGFASWTDALGTAAGGFMGATMLLIFLLAVIAG